MSSQQTNLTDTWETQDTEEITGAEDAASAPTQRVEYDDEGNECQHCGNTVSSQFVRIFGSNNGVVHCCNDCATFRELQDGCAARPGYVPDGDDEVNW